MRGLRGAIRVWHAWRARRLILRLDRRYRRALALMARIERHQALAEAAR